jgi:hypothetical protein
MMSRTADSCGLQRIDKHPSSLRGRCYFRRKIVGPFVGGLTVQDFGFFCERPLLVVQRQKAGRAKDGLSEPPHAEQNQKHADCELQCV